MKLAKLLLATGLFVSIGAFAQSTPPTTAAPTGSTGEGQHQHHWMRHCVHKTLQAEGIHFPGKGASPDQMKTFFEAKDAAMQKCAAEHPGASATAPTH
jgi:hypothetical protein